MEILNELPPQKFREIDDLLAFVSIYDDRKRIRALRRLLRQHRDKIRNRVCMEAGCGFGIFAEEMAQLGAKKVYAVEQNPRLFRIAQRRLRRYANITVLATPIEDFRPPEPIDLLFQELYGQLLYDEDLWVLDHLPFQPGYVIPNEGRLLGAVLDSRYFVDTSVTPDVLQELQGVLVDGLFEDKHLPFDFEVLHWRYGQGLRTVRTDISDREGDLLAFGVEIRHDGKPICRAGECPNWSCVWTPRAGNRFTFEFRLQEKQVRCHFHFLPR